MIHDFIKSVIATHRKGNATEHSYRPALQKLFNSLDPDVTALNEPRREKVGAPDFSVSRGDIVIGHCEAKDLHIDLSAMKDANLAQQKRYVGGLSNLLYTNCLEWVYYRDGEQIGEPIRIADYLMGVQPIPDRFAALEQLLRTFIAQTPQTITSSRALAERMAGKAILIKDILANSLMEDRDGTSELMNQYKAFKEHLIHDISIKDFADIYAETITYGMFAARLRDKSLNDFSRQEALDLLPKSNPFLRNLFGYIAGPNLDQRISWIIDDLAVVFRASNVAALMEKYGNTTQRNDPFLHFYEDFLKAYNPGKRDARGVWYTPEPIVNFIVRAVDEVIRTDFDLPDGLADTSKVVVQWDTGQKDRRGKPLFTTKEMHRVQILDPATGTGTFLAEAVKQIAPRVKRRAPSIWARYVENDLIPRLHGFELLMASYAMCHLKLDMVLREYGYQPTANPPRVSVYLTNSLEEGEAANQTLPFAQWLSNEVKEANKIKRDMPIMCVIGNPPYSGESTNRSPWIMSLLESYKKEPGGKRKLSERNPKWLNDDYVKFIRMAEAMIAKNGQGVLGFITNHGYLDNPTFRGMRWHLLQTFDKIYLLDLHGNSKKKESTPDGSPDKNVFDIQQGVAIVIAVKHSETSEATEVFHSELWGERSAKYERLWSDSLSSRQWTSLQPEEPGFVFARQTKALRKPYQEGFGVVELMPVNSVGIVTARDALTIDMDRAKLWDRVRRLASISTEDARREFSLGDDAQDWTVAGAKADVLAHLSTNNLTSILYRPFDRRWIYYTGTSRGFVCRPRFEVMRHLKQENFGLAICRQAGVNEWAHVLITSNLFDDSCISNRSKERGYVAPLYLYPALSELDQTRRVNFDPKLHAKLLKLGTDRVRGIPSELAILDYMYGVLHCPTYRQTYAEFLRTDFPRIPWPTSSEMFWDVSDKGGQLRQLHLMDPTLVGETPYPLVGSGDGKVENIEFREGRVWINEEQHFENVPRVSWDLIVGAYQPAQKWLKDRKNRALNFADVQHYQRVLKVLAETDRIMKSIQLTD